MPKVFESPSQVEDWLNQNCKDCPLSKDNTSSSHCLLEKALYSQEFETTGNLPLLLSILVHKDKQGQKTIFSCSQKPVE